MLVVLRGVSKRGFVGVLVFLATACASDTSEAPLDVQAEVASQEVGDDVGAGGDGDALGPDLDELPLEDAPATDAPPDTALPDEVCDPTRPAIVLVHGLLAAGDTWASHAMRFMANGWCRSHLVAFDWNSLPGNDQSVALGALSETIDATRTVTGQSQVVLVGHSAGASLGYSWLNQTGNAEKVSKFVYIGSSKIATLAGGGVPMLNLWSQGDLVITNKGDIDGATNVSLQTEDHYGVATSAASFRAIHVFVAGAVAETDAIVPAGFASAEGRAVAFGDNAPSGGARLDVYEVSPDTGARVRSAADHTMTLPADGHFGPVTLTAGAPYEFVVTGGDQAPVHYYREPLVRPNPFLYLRTLPGPDAGLIGELLSPVPFTKDRTTLVAYGSSRAFIAGVDSLTLDGQELLTAETAAAEKTLIGLFLYDDPESPDGAVIDLFAGFPFLSARDTTLIPPGSAVFTLNGRRIAVQRAPGDPDGAVIASFD